MEDPCVIALKLAEPPVPPACAYIGADKGALFLASQKIHMVLAVGDFDSVRESDLKLISSWSDETVRLNPVKDESDSMEALNLGIQKGYRSFILLGSIGGRPDHTLTNLRLAEYCRYPVVLLDSWHRIEILHAGIHTAEKKNYHYISFFSEGTAEISLEGMKYPLSHRILNPDDTIGLSNEIIDQQGIITVHSGMVIMMQTNDEAQKK